MRYAIIVAAFAIGSCAAISERFESQVKESSTGEFQIYVSLHLVPEEPVEFAAVKGEWVRLAVEQCGKQVYVVSNYREKALEILDGDGEVVLSVYGVVSC